MKVYEPGSCKSVGNGGVLASKGAGFTVYEDDDDEIYGPVPDYDTIKSL
jgi:hypothetical protein